MLTRLPDPWRMKCLAASRAIRKAPKTLVRNTASTSSSRVSTSGAKVPKPALLTSRSMRPWRSTKSATVRTASASTPTSPAMWPAPISSAVRRSVSSSRPVITTSAPLAISAAAMPRPIPSLPPVTRALALSSFMSVLLSGG